MCKIVLIFRGKKIFKENFSKILKYSFIIAEICTLSQIRYLHRQKGKNRHSRKTQ